MRNPVEAGLQISHENTLLKLACVLVVVGTAAVIGSGAVQMNEVSAGAEFRMSFFKNLVQLLGYGVVVAGISLTLINILDTWPSGKKS